jgi:hypothetical protein
VANAQRLLKCVEFDGTGKYLGPKGSEARRSDCCLGGGFGGCTDRQYATELAETLDDYNNGNLCSCR